MATKPLVSIVVPTFNRQQLLPVAVDSLLRQTYPHVEVIVVDDASSDDTPTVMQRYRDSRVRYERMPTNRGIGAVRNAGIDNARGDFIGFLDSDDIAASRRIQRQIRALTRWPAVDILGSSVRSIGPDGSVFRGGRRRRWASPEEIRFLLLFRAYLHTPSVLARRAVFDTYRFDESFRVSEDHEFWIRASERFRLWNLPGAYTAMRSHPQRTTTARSELVDQQRLVLMRRALAARGMIASSDSDLMRHLMLPHAKPAMLRDEPSFVPWAEDWLRRLLDAWSEHCPESVERRAAARVAAMLWYNLCRKDAGASRWRRAHAFAASPLSRPLPTVMIRQLARRLAFLR
jgi:glycosyltransferase involved in cell wall biosynthesis